MFAMFGNKQGRPTDEALLIGTFEAPSGTTATAPKSGLRRVAGGIGWGGLARRVAGTATFVALIAFALFFLLGKNEKAARSGATTFAAALVHNDPNSAPPGATSYVTGVRAYFGPVTSATVIDAHNHVEDTNSDSDTRTYFVVDLLLGTRRGPAVIELEFDNHAIGSDRVSGIHELQPNDAPAVSAIERERLTAAFAKRGGRPAEDATLSGALSGGSIPSLPSVPSPPQSAGQTRVPVTAASPQLRKAARVLSCVQGARGNVAKLQKCTQP